MTTKLSINNLTAETLAWISGPRITSVQITDGNYNVIDDTAANASSIGYILINGNDFDLNPQVLIDTLPVTSLIRVSNSLIRAQIPPSAAASYNIQVINSDGSTAILVNGLTYSSFPAWITGSSLTSIEAIAPINIQLSANEAENSAITYALAASNTLPAGATLYSNGYIQGRVTANANATYNFTVVATDAQNQDTGRAFSLSTTLNTPPAWLGQPDTLPISQPLNLYSNTIVAVDPAIASYIVTSGSLPPGLTLDVGTGVIAGRTSTNNAGNTYSFVVTATDTAGFAATKTISITVGSIGFNRVALLLKTNNINNANNQTFIDSSTNNFRITRAGDATQGTFSPFSQTGWSMYFGGNGNYISTSAGNVVFNPGATGTWTLEGWIYPIASGAFYGVGGGGNYDNSIACYWSSDTNKFSFLQGNGGSNPVNIVQSTTSPAGAWYHYAVSKDSSNFIRMFINGVMVGSKSYSSSISSGNRPVINGVNDANGLGNDGGTYYISNLRWVKGGALYASNTGFTPSTQPLTTSVSSGTCWMLMGHQNNFIDGAFDIVGLNWSTSAGTPSIQAFSPFAPNDTYSNITVGGSGYFDGTGDYLTIPANSAFAPGTGDYTVDGWIYTASNTLQTIWAQTVSGTNYFVVEANAPSRVIQITTNISGAGSPIASANTLQLNAWNHFCVSRANSVITVWCNGSAGTPRANTTNLTDITRIPTIGTYSHATSTNVINGYLSSLRYINGTALSGATVPTVPNTAITNTQALLNFTNASIYDATGKSDVQTVSTAKISTAQSKYANSAMVFNGTSDVLRIPANELYSIATSNLTVEAWIYVTGGGGTQREIVARHNAGVALQWMLELTAGNLASFYFTGTGGGEFISSDTTVQSNTWVHVAGGIRGTNKFVMLNGVYKSAAYTTAPALTNGTVPLTIGATTNPSLYFTGYIEDVRITREAIYTGNTSSPVASLPTV